MVLSPAVFLLEGGRGYCTQFTLPCLPLIEVRKMHLYSQCCEFGSVQIRISCVLGSGSVIKLRIQIFFNRIDLNLSSE
jgi:hypothetical protein